jgi:hypothetical protein
MKKMLFLIALTFNISSVICFADQNDFDLLNTAKNEGRPLTENEIQGLLAKYPGMQSLEGRSESLADNGNSASDAPSAPLLTHRGFICPIAQGGVAVIGGQIGGCFTLHNSIPKLCGVSLYTTASVNLGLSVGFGYLHTISKQDVIDTELTITKSRVEPNTFTVGATWYGGGQYLAVSNHEHESITFGSVNVGFQAHWSDIQKISVTCWN